jgi:hypothetical protein
MFSSRTIRPSSSVMTRSASLQNAVLCVVKRMAMPSCAANRRQRGASPIVDRRLNRPLVNWKGRSVIITDLGLYSRDVRHLVVYRPSRILENAARETIQCAEPTSPQLISQTLRILAALGFEEAICRSRVKGEGQPARQNGCRWFTGLPNKELTAEKRPLLR